MRWKRWAGAAALVALLAFVSYELGVRSVGVRSVGGSGAAADRATASPAAAAADSARTSAGIPADGTDAGLASAAARAGAIADVLAQPTDFARTRAAYELAARADETTLPALVEAARQIEGSVDRRNLLGALIARYGELDPERALEHIAGFEPAVRPELLYRLFSGWSSADLDAAIAAVSGLDTAVDRRTAGNAILTAQADADEQTLAAIRARLPQLPGAAGIEPTTFVRLAMDDPVAALEEAAGLSGESRLRAVAEIGSIWALNDPEAAYAHSRTLSDPTLRNQLLSAVLFAWSESAPARIVGLLDSELDDDDRLAVLNMGVTRIARRDAWSAYSLVQEVRDASARAAALQRVFTTWAQENPAAAAAELANVAAEDMTNLPALVGREFALRSPADALAWAARFDDGFGAAMRNVVPVVAQRNAPLALETTYGLPRAEDRNRAVTSILATVAADDPVAATGYWQQLPPELRSDAAARIITEWRSQDPRAASDWLLGLPRGTERDAGLRMLVVTGPQEAIDIPRLINAIDATAERDRLGRNHVRNLLGEDELRRAEAELGRLDLSPEGRREARRLIDAAAR